MVLPRKHGVEVVSLIGPHLGAEKAHPEDMAQDDFQRLAVFLIHRQKEKGQHEKHHQKRRRTGSGWPFEEKEKRDASQRTASKADKLPLG